MAPTTKPKRGRGRPKETTAKGAMLGVRVTMTDLARLDAIANELMLGTRTAVARAALLLGLDAIERDRSILVGFTKGKP